MWDGSGNDMLDKHSCDNDQWKYYKVLNDFTAIDASCLECKLNGHTRVDMRGRGRTSP